MSCIPPITTQLSLFFSLRFFLLFYPLQCKRLPPLLLLSTLLILAGVKLRVFVLLYFFFKIDRFNIFVNISLLFPATNLALLIAVLLFYYPMNCSVGRSVNAISCSLLLITGYSLLLSYPFLLDTLFFSSDQDFSVFHLFKLSLDCSFPGFFFLLYS